MQKIEFEIIRLAPGSYWLHEAGDKHLIQGSTGDPLRATRVDKEYASQHTLPAIQEIMPKACIVTLSVSYTERSYDPDNNPIETYKKICELRKLVMPGCNPKLTKIMDELEVCWAHRFTVEDYMEINALIVEAERLVDKENKNGREKKRR